jgi:hypothetical protein
MKVTMADADRVKTVEVSKNGQLYVGKDLAGQTVRFAVEVVDE